MTTDYPIQPPTTFLLPPIRITELVNDRDYVVTLTAHLGDGTTISEHLTAHTFAGQLPQSTQADILNGSGLSGVGIPGYVIRLYDASGHLIGEVTVDAAGHWFIPAALFPGGTVTGFSGYITAVDLNGNESQQTLISAIDGTPPSAPIITSQNLYGITGTADPASVITLYGSTGIVVATVNTDQYGNWSFMAPSFPGGTTVGFSGSLTATDAAGNISAVTNVPVFDTIPPERTYATTVSTDGISGITEPGATVTLYDINDNIIATVIADINGNWSFPVAVFPGGTLLGFTGYITSTDTAGNISDKTPLAGMHVQVPDAPVILSANSIALGGTAEAGAAIKLMNSSGTVIASTAVSSVGVWSIPAASFPGGVTNGFSGTCTASNEIGESLPTIVLPIQGVAPAAPVIITVNGTGIYGTSTPGYVITLLTNSAVVVTSTITDNTGAWSIPAANFPLGVTNTFTGSCFATDLVGNQSILVQITAIDAIPPLTPIITLANSTGLFGTSEVGSRISLKNSAGLEVAFTYTDLNGNWTIPASSFSGSVTDNFSGTVTAADVAGNVSPPANVSSIDGTPPATPQLASYIDNVGSISSSTSIAATTDDTTPGFNIGIRLDDIPTLYINEIRANHTYNRTTGVLTPATALTDGYYSFSYTLTDSVGNESLPSASIGITVDTIASVTALSSYTDNIGNITSTISTAVITDDTRPGMNIGTGLVDSVALYINGSVVLATYDPVAGTLTPDSVLVDGLYTFSYQLTDAAGNVSLMSPLLTMTIDTVSPATPSSAPANLVDSTGTSTGSASSGSVIDDSTPGINIGIGLTETPSLYVDGVLVASTYDPVTGILTPNIPIGDGPHVITYTLTDSAGNESGQSPPISVVIDTTVPTVSLTTYTDNVGSIRSTSSIATTTDDSTPGMNIGMGILETTQLYIDGVLSNSVYDPVAGTLTPATDLPDATYAFTYKLINAAGNASLPSATLTVTIDTLAPVSPVTSPQSYVDDIGSITNNNSIAATTDDTRPGINIGTGITGIITLYANHLAILATYNSASGIITPNIALIDGSYDFTYTLSDVSGNESSHSPSLSIRIDTLAPLTPTSAPASYDDNVAKVTSPISVAPVTNDTTPGINIGYGLVNTPNLYVNGVLTPATYNIVTGTLTPNSALSDGLKNITYSLTDAAGNESAKSPVISITIDTVPPTTITPTTYNDEVGIIQSTTNSSTDTDDTTPGINIGAGVLEAATLYINSTPTQAVYDIITGTLTPVNPLADGMYQFTYTLTDLAGNESILSPILTITVDTIAPATPSAPASYGDNVGTIQGSTHTAPTSNDTTPNINITAGLLYTPRLYIDTVMVASTYNATNGTITPTVPLTEGLKNISYSILDLAGNISAQSPPIVIIIDTTPPPTPLNAPTSYIDIVGTITSTTSTAATTNANLLGINIPIGLTDTVRLYANDVYIPATYLNGVVTPVTAMADAAYAFTYSLTDPAGNESGKSPAINITIDTIPPTNNITPLTYSDVVGIIQSSTNNSVETDDTRPGINIGAGIVYTAKLFINDVAVAAVYNAVSGTLTPDIALSDATYHFSCTLTDLAGNESIRSPILTITIDTIAPTPPGAPTSYDDNVGTIQSTSSVAPITNDTTPGINVGTSRVHAPRLYVDAVFVDSVYNTVTGTLTPTIPLTEGVKNISYAILDLAGNLSGQSPPLIITIDTTAPTTPSTAPASYVDATSAITATTSTAPTTNDTTPGINIPIGLTDTVRLYANNVYIPATYASGVITPTTGLVDGAYAFTYTLTDVAGNESGKSPAINITIDTTAPTSAFTTYTDNVGTIQSTTSSATATDDTSPGINIGVGITDSPLLYIGGQLTTSTYNSGAGTLTPNTALSDGTYSFAYTLTDAAGNVSALSTAMQITVDTTAPATPSAITQYSDLVGTIQNATSTATTTDATKPGFYTGVVENPNGVKLYVDGTLTASTYDNVAHTITPSSPLSEGAHTIAYSVVDIAGNQGLTSPSFNITIDTTAPTTPSAPASYVDDTSAITSTTSTAPTTNDTTPGINIPIGLTDTVRLYANNVYIPATYTSGVITPTTGLVDGVYAFTYTLTDATGNESGKSPSFNITIDTTAPTPSAPASYVDNVGTTTSNTSTASTTDDNTPGINIGAVTDTPTLYANNVYIPATYSSGVLTPSTALADNTYAFTYTLTDSAGNISGKSPAINITINTATAPPAAPVTPASAPLSYVDNVGTTTSNTSTASTTDDNTPGINIGTVTDTPKLYANNVYIPATYSSGVLTPDSGMTDNTYAFTYTLSNAGGESGKSPAINITIATAPPTFDTIGSGSDTHGYWLGTAGDGTSKLIAAPKSTESYNTWGSFGYLRGTTSTTDGIANTTTLFNLGANAHLAAYYARSLTTGGYSNWYLPAKDELNAMYSNKAVTPFATANPFAGSPYWSSTEDNGYDAWWHSFYEGYQGANNKGFAAYVRAARRYGGTPPTAPVTPASAPPPASSFDTIGSGTDSIGYWLGTAGDGTSKLIVAPKTTEVTRAWGSYGTTRGTTSLNNGIANTTTLFNLGSAAHPAAYYARALTTGGYSNWYLPAKNELATCWSNRIPTPFATANAFVGSFYLSSTERNGNDAWKQYFGSGSQTADGKYNTYYVRAARRSNL